MEDEDIDLNINSDDDEDREGSAEILSEFYERQARRYGGLSGGDTV